jgi:predicted KAP-like P-loop ATPase
MLNDQPTKIDLLDRRPFADSIARVIATQSDPAPQVIAIDGAWGDGKTTVFGFLNEALEKEGLKVVSFNPWRYKDEETMLRAFALGLAEKLGVQILKRSEQWVEVAVDRAELVEQTADAFGAGVFGRLFHLGAKRLRQSIEQLLERAKGLLNEHHRRVTILVDDPDRLDVDQLLGLFRLIKLTADFEWLTFVLAMDCSAIIRTVGRRFGGDDEGRRFLEKIVQVPVRLPAVPHGKLREFTLQQIQKVIDDLKIEVDQDEAARFRNFFEPTLMPLIRTPRSVKQFANVVRFSLGLLPGEINPVDVMILEGMRLFAHDVFERVKEHVIPKVDSHWMDDLMEEREDKADKLMKRLLDGLEETDRDTWRNLLTMLFPAKLSHATYNESDFLAWTDARRVACDEYLIRYLAAVIPDNDVPDAEVTQWMTQAKADDSCALVSSLKEKLNPKTEETMVQKLRRVQRQLTDAQRAVFSVATAKLANQLTLRDIAHQSDVAFGQAAIFAAQCVGNIRELNLRESVASDVIKSASSGIWAVEFFWALPHERPRRGNEGDDEQSQCYLPKEITQRLGVLLSQVLMDQIESSDQRPEVELLRRAFLTCEAYGGLDRVRAWTKNELGRDPLFLGPLVSLMMRGLYSGSEHKQEWPGNEVALKKAKAYTDTEWLVQTFSPTQPEKSQSWGAYISDDEAVFKLFQLLRHGEGEQHDNLPPPRWVSKVGATWPLAPSSSCR